MDRNKWLCSVKRFLIEVAIGYSANAKIKHLWELEKASWIRHHLPHLCSPCTHIIASLPLSNSLVPPSSGLDGMSKKFYLVLYSIGPWPVAGLPFISVALAKTSPWKCHFTADPVTPRGSLSLDWLSFPWMSFAQQLPFPSCLWLPAQLLGEFLSVLEPQSLP